MGAAEPEVSVENFLAVPGVDKPPKKGRAGGFP